MDHAALPLRIVWPSLLSVPLAPARRGAEMTVARGRAFRRQGSERDAVAFGGCRRVLDTLHAPGGMIGRHERSRSGGRSACFAAQHPRLQNPFHRGVKTPSNLKCESVYFAAKVGKRRALKAA